MIDATEFRNVTHRRQQYVKCIRKATPRTLPDTTKFRRQLTEHNQI